MSLWWCQTCNCYTPGSDGAPCCSQCGSLGVNWAVLSRTSDQVAAEKDEVIRTIQAERDALKATVESQEQELIKLSNGVITLAARALAHERRWTTIKNIVETRTGRYDKGPYELIYDEMCELEGKPL